MVRVLEETFIKFEKFMVFEGKFKVLGGNV